MEGNNFFEDIRQDDSSFSEPNVDLHKEEYDFLKKERLYESKSSSEIYSELEKKLVDFNEGDYFSNIKSNLFNLLKKLGFSAYTMKIKNEIKSHKKSISNIQNVKQNYFNILHGTTDSVGLIDKHTKDKQQIQSLITLMYSDSERQKALLKRQNEYDVRLRKTSKLDERITLQKEISSIKIDYDNIADRLQNYKSEFDILESTINFDRRNIDDKKHRVAVLGSYLNLYSTKLHLYELYVGNGSELENYVQVGKTLEIDSKNISKLSEKNDSLEEFDYFLSKKTHLPELNTSSKSTIVQKKKNDEIADLKQDTNMSIDTYVSRFENLF